jgi:hypothetical protein
VYFLIEKSNLTKEGEDMSFNVGGSSVKGAVVNAIETGKSTAEQVVNQKIKEVINDPAKNTRDMQQPSGLSSFLDIKI